jgi:regulator of protease activity HflC (stomatin/prohibitin superfamily)
MTAFSVIVLVLVAFAVFVGFKCVIIVPQMSAYVIERLGKYNRTTTAGLQILVPFLERAAYRHTLKEQIIDVPEQMCITRDNIPVAVDGVVYLQVLDAQSASYGISDYLFASIQLAQTTMRSEIGQLELDKTFQEREKINTAIVNAIDRASEPWGIKVNRYEIKNITPPESIRNSMEMQMRAERDKRAAIATSEGQKQAQINVAEGSKQQMVLNSEGEKQKRINEAEGRAAEILKVAEATAEGIRKISEAINSPGGLSAVNLRIAEQYIGEFGKLAKANNTMIVPTDLANIAGIIATAMSTVKSQEIPPVKK